MERARKQKKRQNKDYKKMLRAGGSGPLRIGQEIGFSEDLYSMFFVTTYKSEFIYFNTKISDGDSEKESKS